MPRRQGRREIWSQHSFLKDMLFSLWPAAITFREDDNRRVAASRRNLMAAFLFQIGAHTLIGADPPRQ